MSESKNYIINKAEVLKGSGLLKHKGKTTLGRVNYMLEHMNENAAYKHEKDKSKSVDDSQLLKLFSDNYYQSLLKFLLRFLPTKRSGS